MNFRGENSWSLIEGVEAFSVKNFEKAVLQNVIKVLHINLFFFQLSVYVITYSLVMNVECKYFINYSDNLSERACDLKSFLLF